MLYETSDPPTGPPPGSGEITLRRFAVRRRVLALAKRRFARQGYDHVSLQEVASGADLHWDDFFQYFRTKESLLNAILEDGWKELLPRLKDIAANSITVHSALLGMLALMTGLLQKDEDLVRLLLLEGRRPDLAGGELVFSNGYRRFLQAIRDLVAQGQRDGSFRPSLHPHVAASILVGALEGMLRDRLVAGQARGTTPYNGGYLMSAFDALVSSLKG